MRPNNFTRKKRQLKVLAEKLQHLFLYHRMEASAQIEKLIQKIKRLLQELVHVLSQARLRKILGAAAILLGISFSYKANAQSFGAPVQNPFGLQTGSNLSFPAFADLDGDGDKDLFVGEYYGVLKYFQNTGTALIPQFAAPVVNPFGLVSTYGMAIPAFADLDGDGDLDLLAGEQYGGMQYFKNTGSISNPHFAAPMMNPFGLVSTYALAYPAFADLDGDGDPDLLVGDANGTMQYFKNTGSISNPNFAAPQMNPFGLVSTYLTFPAFADLDGDGDMDLLVGEYYGTMKYFKNTGSALTPHFAHPLTDPFGLVSTTTYAFPAFADLDGDGDQDLLVGEYYGVLEYFENLEIIIGIADLSQTFNLKLFPNPVSNVLNIDSEEKIDKVEVYNTLGENVMTDENTVNRISLNNLSPGIYMVKVTSVNGYFTTREIQKQ